MARSGDDGAFPVWIWDGQSILGEDGAFPIGIGETIIPPVPPAYWIAEFLLDGIVLWSSTVSSPQQSLTFDVSQYTGKKTIKFRLRRTA